MKGKRVLITDKVHPILTEGLIALGADVDYCPQMPYPDVQDKVTQYNGIVINSKVICDQQFLIRARHLDFIGRLGSGLDIINLPFASEIGVQIISSPEGNANAVGEHAIGMLLSLQQNIGKAHTEIRSWNWNRESNRGEALLGKTIGIIGFGHTGPALAQKLEGMGVQILAFDKYRKDYTQDYDFVLKASMEEIQSSADIISIHLPLTAETSGLIDRQWMQACKPGFILMNTSRGHIVKSSDLLDKLKDEHLSGACLDVLENEKPHTWNKAEQRVYGSLLNMDNVIITPHIAGWTHQSLKNIAQILLDKIHSYYTNYG